MAPKKTFSILYLELLEMSSIAQVGSVFLTFESFTRFWDGGEKLPWFDLILLKWNEISFYSPSREARSRRKPSFQIMTHSFSPLLRLPDSDITITHVVANVTVVDARGCNSVSLWGLYAIALLSNCLPLLTKLYTMSYDTSGSVNENRSGNEVSG